MVHVGLDLSRTRLDVCVLGANGDKLTVTTAPPDRDGLGVLARKIAGFGEPVSAAIESMNGARYIHDALELLGWDVEIADAQKVKGLVPLVCKTDRIDAWVLAEFVSARTRARDLVAGSRGPRGARTGPLSPPSGAPPNHVQEPDPDSGCCLESL
jgi:transposase